MMDDDELIASLAGGDETALRELFARHAPWLAARLRKALPPDDVEDVLQETFLGVQQDFITWFVSDPVGPDWSGPTPAEEAVAIALLARIGAGVPQYPQFGQPSTSSGASSMVGTVGGSGAQAGATATQITAAASRFGSLSSAARHAWLAADIGGLRSGAITLAHLP
jgi:hypothetical protein